MFNYKIIIMLIIILLLLLITYVVLKTQQKSKQKQQQKKPKVQLKKAYNWALVPGGFSHPNHLWGMNRVIYKEPSGPYNSDYN